MQDKYIKLLNCVLLLIFFIILVYIIKLYFTPFFIVLIIVFFTNPIYKFLNKHALFGKQINSLISILVVNGLFFIILYRVGYFIANNLVVFIKNDFINLCNRISNFIAFNKDVFNIDVNVLDAKLRQSYLNLLNNDVIKRGAVYTTEGIFSYLIGNITAYFILIDGEMITNWFRVFVPNTGIIKIKSNISNFKNMFIIELTLVMITTIETILGLMALGIKNPVSIGVVCGILDILPYIGTVIVFVFLIANYIILKQYIIVIGLAALYILLQVNRQILEGKFMSKKLNIHPAIIIISMYISLKIFGIIGLAVGPLYVVTAKEILSY